MRLNGRTTQLPMHGTGKDLGTGLVSKILKDLGLKERLKNLLFAA